MDKTNISKERKEYLKKVKSKKLLVLVTQVAILIAFLALWEVLANKGIIDSFITSKPSKILSTFLNLTANELPKHIAVTTYETVVGFLLGTLIGVIVAIILWWSDFLSKVSEPYLVILNSLPKVALRANNNNLGRGRNTCNYRNGNRNFTNSNNYGKPKWIPKNR